MYYVKKGMIQLYEYYTYAVQKGSSEHTVVDALFEDRNVTLYTYDRYLCVLNYVQCPVNHFMPANRALSLLGFTNNNSTHVTFTTPIATYIVIIPYFEDNVSGKR